MVYNNVVLIWICEGEWCKVCVWLMLRLNDSKLIYNLKLIKDKLLVLLLLVFVVGEYWCYVGCVFWNVFSVKVLFILLCYQVNFQGYWFGLMGIYFGFNIGEFFVMVMLENDKIIVVFWEGDDIYCDILLVFFFEIIDVSIDMFVDCGFSVNVCVDGYYLCVE